MRRPTILTLTAIALSISAIAQTVHELTDAKDIVFARNLTDWQYQPVDSLMFDIYYPTGAMSDKKYPVYFSLHGGSFTTATKQSVTEISDEFAEYGFIVIAPDYRVGYQQSPVPCVNGEDSVSLREAIYRAEQDVNACIRFVANHADLFNADTANIFVGGASAGGTLTLNVGYITDSVAAIYYPNTVAAWGTLQNSGNSEPFNYTIKGLCAMWGGLPYWDDLINSKSAIPSILFKGGKDTNLPNGVGYYLNCPIGSKVRAGLGIYDVMTALQVPCVYHFQPNAGHSAYDNDFCVESASCFFNALMNHAPYSGYYQLYDVSCH